jgi:uncharacterized membrane protein
MNADFTVERDDQEAGEDHAMEMAVGTFLRAGTLLASVVLIIGGALYLIQNGTATPHHSVFRGEPEALRTVPGILQKTGAGSGRGIIQLGLLLLIATPVARVALSAVGFWKKRDWLFLGITLVVLASLVYSIASAYISAVV